LFNTSPFEIVTDGKGNIYASNAGEIMVFNADGNFIDSFKSSQSFGMTVTDNNELYVACRPNVVKYQLP
jgi:hypothetical protein